MAERGFVFDKGGADHRVVATVDDYLPAARTITPRPGDTLGTIALREYGANTPANRDKIERANSTLTHNVRLPR